MIGNTKLVVIGTLLVLAGCASCPVEPDFGSVPRPVSIPFTQADADKICRGYVEYAVSAVAMKAAIDAQERCEAAKADALLIFSDQVFGLQETIKRWEARARIHDEPL